MKPASVVLVILLSALTASVCAAQTNGVPASVTSFGFGGSRSTAPGVPASVTSLGPRGFGPSQCCATRFFPPGTYLGPTNGSLRPHHGSGNSSFYNGYGYVPIYSYGGYYPGYSPVIVAQQDDSATAATVEGDDEESGPTVFEHRGSRRAPAEEAYSRGYEEGRASAEDGRRDRRHADAEEHGPRKAPEEHGAKGDAKADDEPAPAVVVKTVLVYKDAHKEEIANYAIVGDQLFDFTNGRRKIAIADLDVAATTKANDDRGVDFQLPAVRAKK
jgi:hypothetical protein